MNNNTSSAFDFDIFEDIRISKEKADREREEKKRQIMREKAKRNARNRRKLVVVIAVVFAIACTILYRNTIIIQSASTVDTLTNELNEIKNSNTKRELALEQSLDLTYVEEVATRKLGMKRPDKFQTVYIDVTQNNYAEVMMPSNEDQGFKGAFSVINQGVTNVLEYLQ